MLLVGVPVLCTLFGFAGGSLATWDMCRRMRATEHLLQNGK